MEVQLFYTVVTGISVFVFGQIFLKLFIKPVIALKSVFGEVSALFLRGQPEIIGGIITEATQNEIFKMAALILSAKQAIIFMVLLVRSLACRHILR